MSKSTMVELVSELEAIEPRTAAIQLIIAEAKAGEYHDYKNEKYACGKIELVGKLGAEGLTALAERVIDGEFDEEPDDADLAELRRITPAPLWEALGLS